MEPIISIQAYTYTDKTAAIAETERLTMQYGGKVMDLDAPSGLSVNLTVKLPAQSLRQWLHELSAAGIILEEEDPDPFRSMGQANEMVQLILHLEFRGSSSAWQMPGPFA